MIGVELIDGGGGEGEWLAAVGGETHAGGAGAGFDRFKDAVADGEGDVVAHAAFEIRAEVVRGGFRKAELVEVFVAGRGVDLALREEVDAGSVVLTRRLRRWYGERL